MAPVSMTRPNQRALNNVSGSSCGISSHGTFSCAQA
jgi:hypothetical protein